MSRTRPRHVQQVQLTESLGRLPSLWDSSSLTPLPLPGAPPKLVAAEAPLRRPDGSALPAVSYALSGTAATAPLVFYRPVRQLLALARPPFLFS